MIFRVIITNCLKKVIDINILKIFFVTTQEIILEIDVTCSDETKKKEMQ